MGDWQRERRKDTFYKAAKAEGYRARSAFKLKEIDAKFRIMRPGDVVVDLGAAPGGWSQVAKERVGENGVVIGVDLDFVQPTMGVTFVRGDMTEPGTVLAVLERIKERTGKDDNSVDAVVSDMSPNISGKYTMDQARSYWLCENALRFAEKVLKPGGHFIAKIFEGEDFPAFREMLQARFEVVKTFHPEASRKQSSEVYVIAKGFKPGRTPRRAGSGEDTEAWWDETAS